MLDYVLGKDETHTYKKAELKYDSQSWVGMLCDAKVASPAGLFFSSINRAKNLFEKTRSVF